MALDGVPAQFLLLWYPHDARQSPRRWVLVPGARFNVAAEVGRKAPW